MNFIKAQQLAYNTKWSYVNTFSVQFIFGPWVDIQDTWRGVDLTEINLYIKSVNTPAFANSPIEAYIGGQYRIHNGKSEMYRFTVSFRDHDQLDLYRRFVSTFNWQKTLYFDDCKTTVILSKDADHFNEKPSKLYTLENCMIDGVSQVQFSNETEAQIAEFDVEFKCATPLIH